MSDQTRVYISASNSALLKLRALQQGAIAPAPIPAHIPGQLALFDGDAGKPQHA